MSWLSLRNFLAGAALLGAGGFQATLFGGLFCAIRRGVASALDRGNLGDCEWGGGQYTSAGG